jgi:Tol biopolymer transport system component
MVQPLSSLLLRQRRILPLLAVGALSLFAVPASYATFPGTNGSIAWTSSRDGDPEIFSMQPDGTAVTQLTGNAGSQDRFPDWSPDGTKIAFSSTRDGGDFDIFVMNADGSGQTQLTFNSFEDQSPVWSPDGTKLAFNSTEDGDHEIYVMSADGSGLPTQLTFNGAEDAVPAWSPDGTKIAFQSTRHGGAQQIYVMNADGSAQTRLTNNFFQDVQPDWSPDGAKIAFRRDGAGNWAEVYVMNADGTGQAAVTNHPAFDNPPKWSPDGTMMGFSSNRDDPAFEIYTMNADGSAQTRITASPGFDGDVDWGPLATPPFAFAGFFSPVDNPPVVNSAKAGQGIPVKFSLGGDQGLAIFAADYPKSQQTSCDPNATVDGIESTVAAGSSSLSYDPAGDQYTYVWKSLKGWAGTCRQLVVKLTDGTSHRANFAFK